MIDYNDPDLNSAALDVIVRDCDEAIAALQDQVEMVKAVRTDALVMQTTLFGDLDDHTTH